MFLLFVFMVSVTSVAKAFVIGHSYLKFFSKLCVFLYLNPTSNSSNGSIGSL